MLSLPIRAVRKKLQDGSFLPSELCAACISRSKYLCKLNAFVRLTEEAATKQANESDARYKKGATKGPLDGIPIGVKDNFCTRNIETTCSSRMLETFVPPYNATVVQRLQDAGAVLIGKCNMDEFAMGSGTVDSIHGPTKNIWGSTHKYKLHFKNTSKKSQHQNRNHIAEPLKKVKLGSQELHLQAALPTTDNGLDDSDWFIAGGSSGGSAVAVATGSVFAALGSDTGGSTRNPAAYCGVVGFKPTYGLVSRYGLIPLVNSMDVPSILTRCVDDAAVVLNALAGHDVMDSTTVETEFQPINVNTDFDIRNINIGIPKEYHCHGMSQEVVGVWTQIADLLESAGATVNQISMPNTEDSIVCYSILNQCEVASNMARYDGIEYGLRTSEDRSTEELYAASRSKGFNDVVRSRILAGNYFLLQRNYDDYFVQALKVRRMISNDFKAAWSSGIDLLLTPTTITDAPKYSEFKNHDNRTQCATQDFCTQPANMAGCPAISIPIKLSSRGLPLSLQLIGQNFKEETLFSVARWLEQAVDFPTLELVDT